MATTGRWNGVGVKNQLAQISTSNRTEATTVTKTIVTTIIPADVNSSSPYPSILTTTRTVTTVLMTDSTVDEVGNPALLITNTTTVMTTSETNSTDGSLSSTFAGTTTTTTSMRPITYSNISAIVQPPLLKNTASIDGAALPELGNLTKVSTPSVQPAGATTRPPIETTTTDTPTTARNKSSATEPSEQIAVIPVTIKPIYVSPVQAKGQTTELRTDLLNKTYTRPVLNVTDKPLATPSTTNEPPLETTKLIPSTTRQSSTAVLLSQSSTTPRPMVSTTSESTSTTSSTTTAPNTPSSSTKTSTIKGKSISPYIYFTLSKTTLPPLTKLVVPTQANTPPPQSKGFVTQTPSSQTTTTTTAPTTKAPESPRTEWATVGTKLYTIPPPKTTAFLIPSQPPTTAEPTASNPRTTTPGIPKSTFNETSVYVEPKNMTCPQTVEFGVMWEVTKEGSTARQACPRGSKGNNSSLK